MKTPILSDQQTAMQLHLTEYTVQNKITITGGGVQGGQQRSQMLSLALIMRDEQTAEQLCLPQRSVNIYQQKVVIIKIGNKDKMK